MRELLDPTPLDDLRDALATAVSNAASEAAARHQQAMEYAAAVRELPRERQLDLTMKLLALVIGLEQCLADGFSVATTGGHLPAVWSLYFLIQLLSALREISPD